MDNGYLNRYFRSLIVKKLSEVEINQKKSNQHEFHANKEAIGVFGTSVPRRVFKSSFLYLNDEITVNAEGALTWYDCRAGKSDRSPEWRLYFPTTAVTNEARAGDSLFICIKPNNTLLTIITKKESTIESQLYWLFGLKRTDVDAFVSKSDFISGDQEIEFAARTILELIGVEYEDRSVEAYLEPMLHLFQGQFPSTKEFSAYARKTVTDVDPTGEPDITLMKWANREEALFKLMEQYLIKECLQKSLSDRKEADVEWFLQFSLSVHNRRKVRAGLSLENHVEALLKYQNIMYSHSPVTENRSRPDFVFPCIEAYRDGTCPTGYLTMLGAKSTCKDRWRQVLSEADRIKTKHLLSLESAISENQTREMIDKHLQLVVPAPIHDTYTQKQKTWLYTVKRFLDEVREKQVFYEKRQ